MHVCFVISTPFALNAFVAPVIRALVQRGDKVTVVVNAKAGVIAEDIAGRAEIIDLHLARAISPVRDLQVLWALTRLFRERRFDIVHSITPKAGLLAMLAARLAGVPVRIHTFTGQVWATRQGAMRWLLRLLDKVLASCASALLVDSASQCEFLISEKVVKRDRLHVLGQGSISGVNTSRFAPQPHWRQEVRAALGISPDAVLLIYIGRVHPEKGVAELAQAFAQLAARFAHVHLLLAGPDEGALSPALATLATWRERVHVIGMTSEPEKYMAAADIFCLASYREGFGLSLIEAAAAGLPAVASRIYGVTDAVVDGVTGLLVPVRDVHALAQAVGQLVEQPSLRENLGFAARKRAQEQFSQEVVIDAWADFYDRQSMLLR